MTPPEREHLPDTRESITHKTTIASAEGSYDLFFTVGLFPDGRPGEVFIIIGQEGDSLAGAYDVFGIAISMLLQSGWTVLDLAKKFAHTRSVPSGMTSNPDIPIAKSVADYIFRWLVIHFHPELGTAK